MILKLNTQILLRINYNMTLTELIYKLNELIDYRVNKDSENNKNSEVYFFAEDEFQTFDVKIENIEIEDNKIFLSQL